MMSIFAPQSRATTRPRNSFGTRMADKGDIYLDTYGGWYSVRQEAYFEEGETVWRGWRAPRTAGFSC